MAAAAWASFACTIPKPDQKWWDKDTGHELDEIYHVAHVHDACRIIEDGEITAGLIGDESRLKKSRISVAWLSANTWAYGSIYGNVQFKFPWKKLVAGKRVYWVEAIAYGNPAYRFLITDRDLSNLHSSISTILRSTTGRCVSTATSGTGTGRKPRSSCSIATSISGSAPRSGSSSTRLTRAARTVALAKT